MCLQLPGFVHIPYSALYHNRTYSTSITNLSPQSITDHNTSPTHNPPLSSRLCLGFSYPYYKCLYQNTILAHEKPLGSATRRKDVFFSNFSLGMFWNSALSGRFLRLFMRHGADVVVNRLTEHTALKRVNVNYYYFIEI